MGQLEQGGTTAESHILDPEIQRHHALLGRLAIERLQAEKRLYSSPPDTYRTVVNVQKIGLMDHILPLLRQRAVKIGQSDKTNHILGCLEEALEVEREERAEHGATAVSGITVTTQNGTTHHYNTGVKGLSVNPEGSVTIALENEFGQPTSATFRYDTARVRIHYGIGY